MNKKGFTLIELITTFALTATIVILLMNVIVIIKNVYSSSNAKTILLINQANLSNALNSKINNNNLLSLNSCTDSSFCYEFKLINGETIKLIVTESKISFGNYVYKLDGSASITNPEIITKTNIDVTDETLNNSFLIIKIPITSKKYSNDDFGINLIYQYNSNNITLEI